MAAIPPSASINTAHASDELGQIGCKGIGLAGISIDGYRANLAQALARELHEETGLVLTDAHTPWLVWIQTVEFPEMNEQGYAGIANYFFLLHIDTFEPTSGVPVGAAGHPDGGGGDSRPALVVYHRDRVCPLPRCAVLATGLADPPPRGPNQRSARSPQSTLGSRELLSQG